MFIAFASIILSTNIFGQPSKPKFLQLNATVDISGNIKMLQFEGKFDKLKEGDSTVFSKITLIKIINDCKNAIDAINLLSKEGWIFITAVAINKDENGRPNSPFIAYYFRKD
jgi:hypothetical protein